jgi:hypothetical protein
VPKIEGILENIAGQINVACVVTQPDMNVTSALDVKVEMIPALIAKKF